MKETIKKYLLLTAVAVFVFSACKTSKVQSGNTGAVKTSAANTYSGWIKPAIDEQCGTKCHSAQWKAGDIDLSTYAGVKDAAVNGKLIAALQHAEGVEPMPKNEDKWDDATIQLLIDWVNNGASE